MKQFLKFALIFFFVLLISPKSTLALSSHVTGTFSCEWVAGTPGFCTVDFENINCVFTSEGGYVPDPSSCSAPIPSSCETYNRPCIVDRTGKITPPPIPAPYKGHPTVSKFSDNINLFNSEGIGLKPELQKINDILSTFLPYILSFAGVILLFMLISGGFTMLTAVSDPKAADAGKQRISAALLGFILLFISYWIIQILEIVLGITILG